MENPILERAIHRGLERWAPEGTFRVSGGIDVDLEEGAEADGLELEGLSEVVVAALVEAIESTRFGPAFCAGLGGAPHAVEAFRSQLTGALSSGFGHKLEAFKKGIAASPVLRRRLGPFVIVCRRLAEGDEQTARSLLDQLCLQLAG